MILNPNVNVNITMYENADEFTPDVGYALWDDTEITNMDENGNPFIYSLVMIVPKNRSENIAPHIWARLIDDTMDVYGKGNGTTSVY